MDVRIAMVVRGHADPDLAQAHRDFHLAAGVEQIAESEPSEADWTIESGPDEFWWPHGGTFSEVLGSVPAEFGAVRALVRRFVPVAGEGSFPERMIYRLAPQAPIEDPTQEWRPSAKVVRRGGAQTRVLRGWYPIEVLHFPARSGAEGYTAEWLARAVAEGLLRVDTRLRDALRLLGEVGGLTFPTPDLVDDAELALDAAVLGEADVVRTHARLDELEERLSAVESTLPAMLKRKLRSLFHGSGGQAS